MRLERVVHGTLACYMTRPQPIHTNLSRLYSWCAGYDRQNRALSSTPPPPPPHPHHHPTPTTPPDGWAKYRSDRACALHPPESQPYDDVGEVRWETGGGGWGDSPHPSWTTLIDKLTLCWIKFSQGIGRLWDGDVCKWWDTTEVDLVLYRASGLR